SDPLMCARTEGARVTGSVLVVVDIASPYGHPPTSVRILCGLWMALVGATSLWIPAGWRRSVGRSGSGAAGVRAGGPINLSGPIKVGHDVHTTGPTPTTGAGCRRP